MPITSMDDLPQDIQNQESATFDFNKVRNILTEGYYRGPSVHDDDSHRGMRRHALRGDPTSHRTSILRKATDTNLLEETSLGYATTPRGYDILDEMTICDQCGGDKDPVHIVVPYGRHRAFTAVHTYCMNCEDPTGAQNTSTHQRDDDELERAVRAMESNNVICYLNGLSLSGAISYLGI